MASSLPLSDGHDIMSFPSACKLLTTPGRLKVELTYCLASQLLLLIEIFRLKLSLFIVATALHERVFDSFKSPLLERLGGISPDAV